MGHNSPYVSLFMHFLISMERAKLALSFGTNQKILFQFISILVREVYRHLNKVSIARIDIPKRPVIAEHNYRHRNKEL